MAKHGVTRLGKASRVVAWQGKAWLGKAWLGKARHV
jgi:hypothetical protein